ncbi:MAG TPA: hypothetical protein VF157_13945, partial [Chloroflexota bacterium]
VAKDVFRVFKISTGRLWVTHNEQTEKISGNADIEEGGHSIRYSEEDPYIREEYQEAMRREGGEFTMPASLYDKESAAQRAAEPAMHV